MKTYDTLTEAVEDLNSQGYIEDFIAEKDGVKAINADKIFNPEDLLITERYHFEGDTDPDNDVELYVIEAHDGMRGTLVMSSSSEHNNEPSTLRKIPMK